MSHPLSRWLACCFLMHPLISHQAWSVEKSQIINPKIVQDGYFINPQVVQNVIQVYFKEHLKEEKN